MYTKNKKKIGTLIIILISIFFVIFIISNILNKIIKKSNEKDFETIKTVSNSENKITIDSSEDLQSDEQKMKNRSYQLQEPEIMSYYKGYPVIAKLEIPKIHLETEVLKDYSDEALKVSVTKFYKGNPNQIGNFCIAGHNYITSNMFHYLKDLEITDKLYLTDAIFGKMEYEIYDKEIVNPKAISCLSQETDGKVELTLITCTTDSKNRIIIKAIKN